jgi:hypothetical protein
MADAPFRQLPRLRSGVLADLAARLLDRLGELLDRLRPGDEDQHGVRRQVAERLLERVELTGLPRLHAVHEHVARGGLEAQHRERAGHLGGIALPGVEGLQPARAALVLGAPANTGAPGVDLGVVVAADEVGGLEGGHAAPSLCVGAACSRERQH